MCLPSIFPSLQKVRTKTPDAAGPDPTLSDFATLAKGQTTAQDPKSYGILGGRKRTAASMAVFTRRKSGCRQDRQHRDRAVRRVSFLHTPLPPLPITLRPPFRCSCRSRHRNTSMSLGKICCGCSEIASSDSRRADAADLCDLTLAWLQTPVGMHLVIDPIAMAVLSLSRLPRQPVIEPIAMTSCR